MSGALLLAIAVGDLVAGGLAGTPRSRSAAVAGLLTAAGIIAAGLALSSGIQAPILPALVTVLPLVLWYLGRPVAPGTESPRPPIGTGGSLSLAGLLASLVSAVLILAPAVAARPPGALLPADATAAPGLLRLPLLAGIVLFQAGSANAIVREVLRLAEVRFDGSSDRLKAGRVIGLLERLLILGLAIHDLTAAALVVSAKSLLRFPEISSSIRSTARDPGTGPPPTVSDLTEYFLLGSLASWSVALATLLFARSAL